MNSVTRKRFLPQLATMSSFAFVVAMLLTATIHADTAAAPQSPEVAAEPEPWTLTKATGFDQFLDPLGLKIYGWIEQSYTYNGRSPHDRVNDGRVFDDRSNDYRLNQVALNFERELPEGKDFAFGGKVELMVGSDARFLHQSGLSDKQTDTVQFDPVQFFFQLRAPIGNGLVIKGGRYNTTLGAEVIDAPGNALYSRSYLFGFAIPFTHTGVQLDYPINDNISIYYGLVQGWDQFNDANSSLTHMFGVYGSAMDNKFSYYLNLITGPEADGENTDYRTVFDAVLSYTWSDTFSTTLNVDWGNEAGAGRRSESMATGNNWYGAAVYGTWVLCPTVNGTVRAEYFRDETGSRFPSGNAGEVFEVTAGLDVRPFKHFQNLRFRPEVRYDRALGDAVFDSNDSSKEQFTIGADLIITF